MDKRGKICAFSHPITCKKFDNFGFKENGCKNRKCEKLHLNVCKIFMRHKSCKYGEDCRFYHPKKLKNSNQMKPENQSSQKHNEEQPSYANIVRKNLEPLMQADGHFLGLQPVHQKYSGQVQQVQQPCPGQINPNPQAFLEMQKSQKQMMDLFIGLNQKLNNIYSQNFM